MKSTDFIVKVNKKEIKNGTKFNVYHENKKIGVVGVIDTTVVYLDMATIPVDLYTENYIFEEIGEKKNEED